MIENLRGGECRSWEDVPISTAEEVWADQAAIRFSAEASLSEKVQRVFNDAIFFIAGAYFLMLIPPVAAAGSALSGMGFAIISGTSLLQIPAVLTIIAIAPKVIVTLALLLVVRKIIAVVLYHIIYPAVLDIYTMKQEIDNQRRKVFEELPKAQFECRYVVLNKPGIDYRAFAIEHEKTKGNGKWVIIAGGNKGIGEYYVTSCAEKFKNLDLNVLYVNGPGVARSSGFPTNYSIGAGQEAGLQFLEKLVGAKKILLYGISLGGGAQAEAIQSHEFREDVDYLVWSDRTFDCLSNVASCVVTSLAKPVFFLVGIELDGVAGARKLQELNITHIVTQNSEEEKRPDKQNGILRLKDDIDDSGSDDVIPNQASLYVGLKKASFHSQRVKCYGFRWVFHGESLPKLIEDLVVADIQAFLAKAN